MNDVPTTDSPLLGDVQIDRVDELLSLFFDDCLSAEQVAELNELLLSDSAARARSFDAAQLHADLHAFFGETPSVAAAAQLPSILPASTPTPDTPVG